MKNADIPRVKCKYCGRFDIPVKNTVVCWKCYSMVHKKFFSEWVHKELYLTFNTVDQEILLSMTNKVTNDNQHRNTIARRRGLKVCRYNMDRLTSEKFRDLSEGELLEVGTPTAD